MFFNGIFVIFYFVIIEVTIIKIKYFKINLSAFLPSYLSSEIYKVPLPVVAPIIQGSLSKHRKGHRYQRMLQKIVRIEQAKLRARAFVINKNK